MSKVFKRERLVHLNKCKSGALSTVTVKRNEIERLMQDIRNYEQVKNKATVFTKMFGRYMEAQQKLIQESKEKDQKLQAIPTLTRQLNIYINLNKG